MYNKKLGFYIKFVGLHPCEPRPSNQIIFVFQLEGMKGHWLGHTSFHVRFAIHIITQKTSVTEDGLQLYANNPSFLHLFF